MRGLNRLAVYAMTLVAACTNDPQPVPGPGPTPTNRVTITLAGNGSGQVTSTTPGVIACPAKCEEVTTDVTLQAQPDAGSVFDGWSGDCQGSGTCQVQPNSTNGDQSVTATFSLQSPGGGSTITWDGGGDGVSWTDALNWNPDQVPAAQDTAVITTTTVRHAAPGVTSTVYAIQADNVEVTNGTLAVTTDAIIQNLTIDTEVGASDPAAFDITGTLAVAGTLAMQSAALNGSGTVDASGQLTWGGTRNDMSVAQLNISGTAVASAQAGGRGTSMPTSRSTNVLCRAGLTAVLSGALLTLDDTDLYDGGDSWCPAGFPPGGILDVNQGGTLRAINSGRIIVRMAFNNNGTVEIENAMEIAGRGDGTGQSGSGNHTGLFTGYQGSFATLSVRSGFSPLPVVNFLAGSDIQVFTLDAGVTSMIAGTLNASQMNVLGFGSLTTIQPGATVTAGNNLNVAGGHLRLERAVDYSRISMRENTLEIAGGVSVTTPWLYFEEGILAGGGTLSVTDQLSMPINDDKEFDGVTLVFSGNNGSWIDGLVLGRNGARFQNDGFFLISDVSNLTWDGTNQGGGGMDFVNNGTVTKSGGGTTTMTVCYSGAAVNVQDGVFNLLPC